MNAQSVITGDWHGLLEAPGVKLRLVFHLSEKEGALSGTMDSPDQKAFGIPAQTTTFEAPNLLIKINNLLAEYRGVLQEDGNEIKGTFTQGGAQLPLNLRREVLEAPAPPKRPQVPEPPYPYYTEDVVFSNTSANIQLAGTLSLPEKNGKFPIAVLISGSGPQNRDAEMMGHKPFLVLSDFLTRQGIGVLRFDERGVGASTGVHATATSADLTTDVLAAITYLKSRPEADVKKIGLIGHSEGGMIAPLAANLAPKDVAFIIMLAGPGVQAEQILYRQQELIARASGMPEEQIAQSRAFNERAYKLIRDGATRQVAEQALKADFMQLMEQTESVATLPDDQKQAAFTQTMNTLYSPWIQYFLSYDPQPVLQKVKCPVLALNGDKDLQVDPAQNLPAIAAALKKAKNKDATTMVLPGLNHLFQTAVTGNLDEYDTLEETFAPAALRAIADWLKPRVLKK